MTDAPSSFRRSYYRGDTYDFVAGAERVLVPGHRSASVRGEASSACDAPS